MSVEMGYLKTSIDHNTIDDGMLRYHDFELIQKLPSVA